MIEYMNSPVAAAFVVLPVAVAAIAAAWRRDAAVLGSIAVRSRKHSDQGTGVFSGAATYGTPQSRGSCW